MQLQQQLQQQLLPQKGNADSSVFLKDVAVEQNAVASASAASSPTPVYALAHMNAHSSVEVADAGLKPKLPNPDLSLKDNTQSQIPIAVSSPSSLSSKALIVN